MKDIIKWDKPCYKCLSHLCDLSCKETLAQPEQRSANEHLRPVGFYDARGNDICIEIPMGESKDWWQPVYTAPPQRTAAVGEDTRKAWVGLTDEQIEAIAEEFGVGGWICDFARAIEAELKEENDC